MNPGTALITIGNQAPLELEVLDPEPEPALRPVGEFGGQAQAFAGMIARMVVEEQRRPKFSDSELDFLWGVAFQEWLETGTKTGDPRPRATFNAYKAAWDDLLRFCPKHPRGRCSCPALKYRQIDELHVKAWVEDLRTRAIDPAVERGLIKAGRREPGQLGLSPSTVNQWLAGVSSFYSYCQNYPVRTADGSTAPLFGGLNPAKSQIIKRPRARRMGENVTWLDDAQLHALRDAIRCVQTTADVRAGVASCERSVIEQRDYALFTSYIMTGARNNEVRMWRWRDLRRVGRKTFYHWENKGKDGDDELPEPCWQAVQDYLRLAGRLETMQPDDFIFQPVSDGILHLRRADGLPAVDPATWDRNRALTQQEINRKLRLYCKRAGIAEADIPRLHVHSLRHSANMLYSKAGVPVEDRSKMLHHESLDMTMRYTHRMEGQANANWAKAAELLGL